MRICAALGPTLASPAMATAALEPAPMVLAAWAADSSAGSMASRADWASSATSDVATIATTAPSAPHTRTIPAQTAWPGAGIDTADGDGGNGGESRRQAGWFEQDAVRLDNTLGHGQLLANPSGLTQPRDHREPAEPSHPTQPTGAIDQTMPPAAQTGSESAGRHITKKESTSSLSRMKASVLRPFLVTLIVCMAPLSLGYVDADI